MLLPLLASLAALVPTLHTSAPCYLQQQQVKLDGTGYTPGAPYKVTLDKRSVGAGVVPSDGTVAGTLSSGKLASGQHLQRKVVAIDEGKLIKHARFYVSSFTAGFTPAAGDSRTLLVRFAANGLGIASPSGTRVWLHYVDPRGHLISTLGLGRTSGACGDLKPTAQMRLFPFQRIRAGRWKLQFDVHHNFNSAVQPRITRQVTVR